MTASIRIVNDGNCEGDVVTVRYGADHALHQTLALGDVSGRLSAYQTIKLESVHEGPSVGQVRVHTIKPGEAEGVAAGKAAYQRYVAVAGRQSPDEPMENLLPDFASLSGKEKAGWLAAAGVDSAHNPFMRNAGGG